MAEIKSYELEKRFAARPQSFWECPVYLLIGEESFLKEELISDVCRRLKIKERDIVDRFDGEIVDGRDLMASLETTSFDENKRIVLIYNADKIDNDTCKKMYEFWEQAGFPQSALPIFITENRTGVDGRRQLWKLVKEEGLWAKFWTLFEDKVLSWIRQRATMLKIKLARGCDMTMVELCGNDLRKISKELEKLSLVYDQNTITPETIRFMVRKSTEVSKYEIEDQFVTRNIQGVTSLLLEVGDKAEPKDITMGLLRCTRHALQAQFYLKDNQDFAFQLAEVGKQICALARRGDWNSISKRGEMIKAGDAIIAGIPMQTKMMWSGDYNFNKSAESSETTTQTDIIEEDGKKKRKTKKDKIANYEVEAETKKAEVEAKRKANQDLSYDVSNHNIWAQRGSIPIAKAFLMAKKYSEAELISTMIKLSQLYCSVWLGEGDLIQGKLETVLAELKLKI